MRHFSWDFRDTIEEMDGALVLPIFSEPWSEGSRRSSHHLVILHENGNKGISRVLCICPSLTLSCLRIIVVPPSVSGEVPLFVTLSWHQRLSHFPLDSLLHNSLHERESLRFSKMHFYFCLLCLDTHYAVCRSFSFECSLPNINLHLLVMQISRQESNTVELLSRSTKIAISKCK